MLAVLATPRLISLTMDACVWPERKLALCGEALSESRSQYALALTRDGWRPPADPATSAVWTYEPA